MTDLIYFSLIITISILLTLLILNRTISVFSHIDGRFYNVQNYTDKKKASDMLAHICSKMHKFINNLNDPKVSKLKTFKCSQLSEGSGILGYTSYTKDKNDIVLCLRDKKTKKIHSENLLTYVAVHELAHIMSKTYGHNEEFRKNFRWLLEQAEYAGIYTHEDYSLRPQEYCGILVH